MSEETATDVVSSLGVAPGKQATINNPNRCSVLYEVTLGDAGSAEFTVVPGGYFTVTAGVQNISINLKQADFGGISGVVDGGTPPSGDIDR